jgi:phenylalanine-4-hydroxylase
MEMNEVLEKLPKHLMSLVIDQPYNEYTEQDHAVWRYVMRQNVEYLSKVAHGSYLDGLKRTGISIEKIPHMYGMNRILKEIGWAAVAVDGFIPPAAFMEFQAYNVLVIAADIRPIDQIEYTPAPDIIHEAAGHAPIIADPTYAAYLRHFGEIGAKAFSSAKDYEQYEAIRRLSILKADPYTSKADIEKAEVVLDEIERNLGTPSEMSLLRNLHWWTVEYGLIGDLRKPKIYGAGLLSSIGESYSCLKDDVKKIPYSIEAVNYNFDITTRQPQLFVTPNFERLTDVLDEFAAFMAFRRGGLYGIQKAIESQNTATCVYSSGLQVSGTFHEVIAENENPVYLKTNTPTQLCFKNRQIEGHGVDYHQHGFGSPVGRFKHVNTPPELLSHGELQAIGIEQNKSVALEFESGVLVKGRLEEITRKEDLNLLFTFTDCTVSYNGKILFEPKWGKFDMAVGSKLISAYTGPADPYAFGYTFPVPSEKTHKIIHTQKAKTLHQLYGHVRFTRETGKDLSALIEIWRKIKTTYPEEWLLPIELLELLQKGGQDDIADEIRMYLLQKQQSESNLVNLISNGLNLQGS